MRKILGLDLGTNSIGWAVVNSEVANSAELYLKGIEAAGSRIIPMDAATMGDFDKGNTISQTAERTRLRGMRRLHERYLLRRERLHRVLDILGFLPSHYSKHLNRYGAFINNAEPKLPWKKGENDIFEFLFMDSFNEMLEDFKMCSICSDSEDRKIPYDWTLYYLRKKALTQKISKEELAWILLNFNKKRGYYQLREEVSEEKSKSARYYSLKVVNVEETSEKKGKETWYNVHLENGWIYRRSSNVFLDWVGKTKDCIVTEELNDDGTIKKDKSGNEKRSLSAPKEDDWMLLKEKTQCEIENSGKSVGAYIYDALLQNPTQKIRGKLICTIERKFYKSELEQIIAKQIEFHSELQSIELYSRCIDSLYPNNRAHYNNIQNRGFKYLFVEDIIFYQRPLKSKKSLINNCAYEEHEGVDRRTGKKRKYALKCIAKSHPLFQEFRLWQFISNLRIYKIETRGDVDVTSIFLKNEDEYVALFDWLKTKKTIDQKTFFKYEHFALKKNAEQYRWNCVEDKAYPCCETHALFLSYLKKAGVSNDFLTSEIEERLWHILYSIDNKNELSKALKSFADKNSLDDKFVDEFKKIPPFEKEYASYSAKAIKRLLPLMRMGKYWSADNFDSVTFDRIEKIITGEYDDSIRDRVREKSMTFTDVSSFRGIPLWLACYIVYNRHSEAKEIVKWQAPSDIDKFLATFKQHSLRNPIVEQVVMETMRTVRDIWTQVGHIDEIHIELGREMKNSADRRKRITNQVAENERTNLRIKALLAEFANPEFGIENVRPYSPSQQELLRIYEEGVLNSVDKIEDDIANIIKKFNESDFKKRPTRSDVLRYKLWLEQKYRSPYTGEFISLSKLFTSAYEIEHIIPQSQYFDDSLSNKVICESEINKKKDKRLAMKFIKDCSGEKVELAFGKVVRIFTESEYEQFVKEHYAHNREKMKKLFMDSIPDGFIARQLNDSRYISKYIKGLLSNIVREDDEVEAVSKNVITCTGGVTDRLKKDWGVNDVWNKIILSRFERLNVMGNTSHFTTRTANGHIVPAMPLELQKGFSKKRIDHRHHAMDAIVISCATRNIVNYLNNESARANAAISRYDLQTLLCDKVKNESNGYKWQIKKPWESFTADVYRTLNSIVVSFKQNLRVLNNATNMYCCYENGEKVIAKQAGKNWAIRKSLHKDTVYGEIDIRMVKTVSLNEAVKCVNRIVVKDFKLKLQDLLKCGYDLKRIKKYFEENSDIWQDINLKKIAVYYFASETNRRFFATRKPLDTTFDKKKIEEHIADTGIQKILLRHLADKDNNPELAFSPDGVDEMNNNIIELNNGKKHQPIYKVRVYEEADKFAVGTKGNKHKKFVEAAKGTNLYFAVYENESIDKTTGETVMMREYDTIPLYVVIDRLKRGLSPVPPNDNGKEALFVISPNDLVYVPTEAELQYGKITTPIDVDRIYKMVSSTGNRSFFVKESVSSPIIDKYEYSSLNKMERAITGEMIKEICVPIKVDRLGNIVKM